jgi:hypothetical protein
MGMNRELTLEDVIEAEHHHPPPSVVARWHRPTVGVEEEVHKVVEAEWPRGLQPRGRHGRPRTAPPWPENVMALLHAQVDHTVEEHV